MRNACLKFIMFFVKLKLKVSNLQSFDILTQCIQGHEHGYWLGVRNAKPSKLWPVPWYIFQTDIVNFDWPIKINHHNTGCLQLVGTFQVVVKIVPSYSITCIQCAEISLITV